MTDLYHFHDEGVVSIDISNITLPHPAILLFRDSLPRVRTRTKKPWSPKTFQQATATIQPGPQIETKASMLEHWPGSMKLRGRRVSKTTLGQLLMRSDTPKIDMPYHTASSEPANSQWWIPATTTSSILRVNGFCPPPPRRCPLNKSRDTFNL